MPSLDDLSPWEGVAGFGDTAGDTAARNHASSNDSLPAYTDETGRNDIVNVRAVYDAENLYFLITCAKDVTAYEAGDRTWMNLFLSAGGSGWNGFDYVVNRTVTGNTASVERLGTDGRNKRCNRYGAAVPKGQVSRNIRAAQGGGAGQE